jgi:hypothetical protein
MARVIQEHIKKPLADEVLFGRLGIRQGLDDLAFHLNRIFFRHTALSA